ncbi:MAG: mechanosensitive ion channel family protein [Deltaproteobacteria bacterium]|jgi:small-conductance mechanosensitive channel|nr:mechanosensitive ion channel family protein [Deltaproteobacteria bacterium]
MFTKNLKLIVWIGLLFLYLGSTAWSQNPMLLKKDQKKAASGDPATISLPKDLNATQVDEIVAGLSDEQVRRLLINELKMQAEQETTVEAKPKGVAGLIDKIKNLTSLLQTRIEYIRSGGRAALHQTGGIYTFLGRGERGTKSVARVIISVAAVLAGALLIEWLFTLYTAAARRRIASSTPSGWIAKIGSLGSRALLDLAAIIIFIVAALVLFFLFLDRTAGQRVLLAAYLAGIAFFQGAYLVLRFFLSPRTPALRILPFSDEAALYLHYWLMALIFVICFGNVTKGVIGLAGATELAQIKFGTVVGLIATGMIIWMIMHRRKTAAATFSSGFPESSLRYRLAQKWHHFAIFAVLLLLAAAIGAGILGTASNQAVLTLLMVPLYFLLDWILRLMLAAAFGIVEQPQEQPMPPAEAVSEGSEDDVETEAARPPAAETLKDESAPGSRLDLERMKGPLRTALRLSLAVLMFLWTLDIWSVDLPIGEEVVETLIEILGVVLICYVAWGLINAAIMRRMREEMPQEEDEEQEEGGAGGSRIATLLLLLRKFMLVVIIVMAGLIVLSSLGVNIGPLIAGAGVFGLAIGFGAQTLVRDIISGVFFLMDDAFRVGDYLEVSGTKGTVEHISLRSIRLRNPRGMVYFIPFGDMKTVTNLSRDYVIMKLDFRVRYDADVEKIRKVIKKKVYQPIINNPELGPKLLEPIKSQGVREMDDSAMIMRVKYKTKPGDQFAIRKEVYRLMQEAFKEEGIEFAHRNVTVYLPSEAGTTATAPAAAEKQPDDANSKNETQRQAAAAAALAAVQAEEEEKAKMMKPEK